MTDKPMTLRYPTTMLPGATMLPLALHVITEWQGKNLMTVAVPLELTPPMILSTPLCGRSDAAGPEIVPGWRGRAQH
jgi:hypothetical protein